MKKEIRTLAALLIASAAFVACSSSDDSIENQQPTNGKYTMTIQAGKGDDATTRALSLVGSTLNATWTAGDKVTVYNETKNTPLDGELTAQSSGVKTTLTGTLTGTIDAGDKLILKFLSNNYDSQEGTLEYIANNCDYATASVTVASVLGGIITPDENPVTFVNQQAIIKFTLKDKSDNAISATKLVVNNGTTDYTINLAPAASVIYVAIPGFSGKLSLNANNGSYTFGKSDLTFNNGKYYEITVKMTGH